MPGNPKKSRRSPSSRRRPKRRTASLPAQSGFADNRQGKTQSSARFNSPIRNRDPLYEKIIERLGGLTDGDKFEACVADLLRAEWPTLIPIPGGDDAGLDGAWSDEMGDGLLIATTGIDVVGNVTRNLKKHRAEGGQRCRVLVATTQSLTARRIRNIDERIRSLGFSPAHLTYARQALADRLYRNSRWLKELLGISGRLSALSRVPKRIRPLGDIPMVGRAEDLEWLLSTKGDRLLIGQPGIGKTFLSQSLVNAGHALFAVDNDIHRLLDAIRDQSPQIIIFEDAHLRLDTLESLCQSRVETGADFEIVADCWPNFAAEVRAALGLTESQCRQLRIVTGSDIVQIVKHAGIHGPSWLLHSIVRQSGGCPGRAALLAQVTLHSRDLREVAFGKTLTDWVHSTFRKVAENRGFHVLAAIALNGDEGISMERLGKLMECGSSELLDDLADLAYGGVVYQMLNGNLSVRPDVLRGSLVAQYFFDGQMRMPLESFVSQLPNVDSVCGSLIEALECGASVPTEVILQNLSRTHDKKVWERFAWTSAENACHVLQSRPSYLVELAPVFLSRIPEIVLPQLVGAAVGDNRELHSHPSHPLRRIESWARSAVPGSREVLARRHMLLDTFLNAIHSERSSSTAFRLLKTVVTPRFEVVEQTPGNPDSYCDTRGFVTDEELSGIAALWTRLLEILRPLPEVEWSEMCAALDEWLYGGSPFATVSKRHSKIRASTAKMVIEALITHPNAGCGVRAALRSRLTAIGCSVSHSERDSDFLVLFPEHNVAPGYDSHAATRANTKSVVRLVAKWCRLPTNIVTSRLVVYQKQSRYVTGSHDNYLRDFCKKLAGTVQSASEYVQALLDNSAAAELILPFLDEARIRHEAGWLQLARQCLHSDCQRVAGLEVMIGVEQELAEDCEVDCVLAARTCLSRIDFLVMTGRVPHHRLRRLLEDQCIPLAETVALAMWRKGDSPRVLNALQILWSRVIAESSIDGLDLAEIFRANAHVAFLWLVHRVSRATRHQPNSNEAIAVASAVMNPEQKRIILDAVVGTVYEIRDIVKSLIASDRELYREYFEKLRERRLHLAPLGGEPNSLWASMASVALAGGIEPACIVDSAFRDQLIISGSWAAEEKRRAEIWKELKTDQNPEIRQIASLGYQMTMKRFDQESRREQEETFAQLYG
jgi:hypothetical protein